MPTYVKGGVWTNVEDEILRAAVSKYGLNQWARVSSLLARKTAKQVKARWTEWLDPAIKKIEWSREEDEKLLHLAKLMPTQWRTIAPIVGRTATQCLERYQKLLDEAEAMESGELGLSGPGGEAQASSDQIRKLRPGEIDPDPESKPARPDAIDMDEDEKEMLSEARARLANTQGKKAKRKDRERLLEESRRLAVLQKRRELKQAGINVKLTRRNRNEMDYNADIPFEHKPASGFYDTTEELQSNDAEKLSFDARTRQFGVKRKDVGDKEATGKKHPKDDSKDSDAAERASIVRAERLQQLQKEEQISKRRKLSLPAPQVKEQELEDIIKAGKKDSEISELYEEGGQELVDSLLGNRMLPPSRMPMRTPMVPHSDDKIHQASLELRALTNTSSSLLGGENTPLHRGGTGFDTSLPQKTVVQTPNPLATPYRRADGLRLETPGYSKPMETPRGKSTSSSGFSIQDLLKKGFSNLPKPKNDFELDVPDEEGQEEEVSFDIQLQEAELEEDAGERERKIREIRKREEEQALQRRSEALKRNLPRASSLDGAKLVKSLKPDSNPITEMIEKEFCSLLISDAIKYPVVNGRLINAKGNDTLPDLKDIVRAKAMKAIDDEVQELGGLKQFTDDLVAYLSETRYKLPGL
ncbi:pre-mRNA splicing factor component-domain-containing protein [Dipodascopsis uninucleata]